MNQPDHQDYASQIKAIIKNASAAGVVFTAKDIARIVDEANAERSDEAARQMYGR